MNVKCPKCKTLLGTPKSDQLHIVICPCGQKLRVKAPKVAAKAKPKNQRYMVTKSWFGKPIVKFRCPECDVKLSDSLNNAGAFEQCPECFVLLLTPGIKEGHEYAAKLDKEKEVKRLKKERAARQNTEAKKKSEARIARKPTKISVPVLSNDGCRSCSCLTILSLVGVFALLIIFFPREETPSSPLSKERMAAIQAEIDTENAKVEAKLEAIRQKVKQVEEFADSNKLVGLTDLAVIEARGVNSSTIDFDLQEAKDLCQRNHGFLQREQDYNQLRLDQLNHVRLYDDDSALTVFQTMYGVSNENTEAACTEWIATKNQPDWDLNEVMAICLRNKAEGIKREDSNGMFKDQAATVIQREVARLRNAQEQRQRQEQRQEQQSSSTGGSSYSSQSRVDRIIEAKAKVRQLLNFPNTASFHNFGADAPKVNGNKVTLTVTAENAFGVSKTHTFTVRVK